MSNRIRIALLAFFVIVLAIPTFASPVPSKASDSDLSVIRDVVSNDQVAQALAQRGLTQDQIDSRLAQMSPQQVHQLAQNLNQIQAAGLTRAEWFWMGVGALAVVILILALS